MPTVYRVRTPLHTFEQRTLAPVVIPAGSTLRWQDGEYAGGLAVLRWLRGQFLAIEAELLQNCDRQLALQEPRPDSQ